MGTSFYDEYLRGKGRDLRLIGSRHKLEREINNESIAPLIQRTKLSKYDLGTQTPGTGYEDGVAAGREVEEAQVQRDAQTLDPAAFLRKYLGGFDTIPYVRENRQELHGLLENNIYSSEYKGKYGYLTPDTPRMRGFSDGIRQVHEEVRARAQQLAEVFAQRYR